MTRPCLLLVLLLLLLSSSIFIPSCGFNEDRLLPETGSSLDVPTTGALFLRLLGYVYIQGGVWNN